MRESNVWQLHEAKARFSELFRRARAEGPQRVVKQRGEAVMIVRAEEYDRTGELARQPESLLAFFRSAAGGRKLNLRRKRDTTRTISGSSLLGLPSRYQRHLPAAETAHRARCVTMDIRVDTNDLFHVDEVERATRFELATKSLGSSYSTN